MAMEEDAAWKLKYPEDVGTSGSVPSYMQFARLQEKHGFPIWTGGGGFGQKAYRTETLYRWLIKKPDLVHHVLRLSIDYHLRVIEYWINTFPPVYE